MQSDPFTSAKTSLGYPVASIVLPPTAASPARARQLVADSLDGQVADRHRDDVLLLVSELVTNSVLHARSTCRLSVIVLRSGRVRVEASDLDPRPPQPVTRTADQLPEGGYGLLLVEQLAADWGHRRERASSKTVWCEISP